ncbi:MAG: anthrone oxygenase family protein [Gammaproteobacteria bacterium]
MTGIIVMAITGAGVVTGLLFAFSNFVMRALATLPDDKGMLVMQRVNETILNPVFLVVFLGTPILCVMILFKSVMQPGSSGSLFLLIGALAYLIGPFGVTVLFNVPLNNKLAKAELSVANEVWPVYQKQWQRWNHVRTCIGVVSIILLAIGLGTG